MKKLLFSIFTLSIFIIMTACGTVPHTKRTQFLCTSIEEEDTMGLDAWNQVVQESKISKNTEMNSAVLRIGQRISSVASADAPSFKWEFKVFESEEANAFCLPGGRIAVYSGLFPYTANDAEMAAVIGHEIAHATCRHSGERVSVNILQSAGLAMIGLVDEDWMGAMAVASELGVTLPYSRDHEYEADYIGLIYMAKAGYDPRAAVSFWNKFKEVGNESTIQEFFSTHPMSQNRINEMNAHMEEVLGYYNKCPQKVNLGKSYKGIINP